MPLSRRQLRRLSVQPEESGLEEDDDGLRFHSSLMAAGATSLVPEPDDDIPFMTVMGRSTKLDMELDFIELRKLSTASMSSSKSSSSLSSTCSAPGTMSSAKKFESLGTEPVSSKRIMTSRPSFISLCSIVSETSQGPNPPELQHRLPAALQVELDLMQRSGLEGDEPKCPSHLPIFRCPSDYDINTMKAKTEGAGQNNTFRRTNSLGLLNGIKQFPDKFRNTEKHRFNVYSISNETREQLKHLYVY
ncbi:unnamed protein product [Orchesella dallaii]|uniref:Uncharacterized protein n=1 Tax=Orchesella dallaii TaxID=48710 RepID=A0ABP1QX32_9HEXA